MADVNPYDLSPDELLHLDKTIQKYRDLIRIESQLGRPNPISVERLKNAIKSKAAKELKEEMKKA